MHAITSLLALAAISIPALAHMELIYPPPLRSKFNPFVPEPERDYSMTSPLPTTGGFPCKGYVDTSPMDSVATWAAGSPINYTVTGSATHGGGSCQAALSYDKGKTWSTIYSHIGGCLVDGLTDHLSIPKEAPSGAALFAWMWVNRLGNREQYMNCASVTITNGGSGLSDKDDYPAPFVANVGVNSCATVEGIDVVYPNPGKNFIYGGDYKASKPTTPAGFTGSNCVPSGQSTGGGGYSGGGGGDAATTTVSSSTTTSSAAATTTKAQDNTAVALPTTTATSAAPASTTKQCKRKSSKSKRFALPLPVKDEEADLDEMGKRHQRLVRRRVGDHAKRSRRVAALKAEHISH